MLAMARDVYAQFFLERQLGRLREAFLEQAIAGSPTPADYWKNGEERIVGEMRETFYCRGVRGFVKPDTADQVSDTEDFDGRTQRLMEHALLQTHRLLRDIPFLGQSEFREA
jgi:hypothetical protein